MVVRVSCENCVHLDVKRISWKLNDGWIIFVNDVKSCLFWMVMVWCILEPMFSSSEVWDSFLKGYILEFVSH